MAIALFVATYRCLRFSNFGYTCLFVVFVPHEIGAHYTSGELRWRQCPQSIAGGDRLAHAGRNDYDRFVHFCYGLLLFPAVWELVGARATAQRLWRYMMPVTSLMAHSLIYELSE